MSCLLKLALSSCPMNDMSFVGKILIITKLFSINSIYISRDEGQAHVDQHPTPTLKLIIT